MRISGWGGGPLAANREAGLLPSLFSLLMVLLLLLKRVLVLVPLLSHKGIPPLLALAALDPTSTFAGAMGCPNFPPAPNATPLLEATARLGAWVCWFPFSCPPTGQAGMTGASPPPLPWLSPLSLVSTDCGWVWFLSQFLGCSVFLAAEWMMVHF
jgi:hypothetical protein